MSGINESCLTQRIENILSTEDLTAPSSSNNEIVNDLVLLSYAANGLDKLNRCSIQSILDLPDLNTTNIPNGHMVYIQDARTHVIASYCRWITIDGQTVSTVGNTFRVGRIFAWGCNTPAGSFGTGTVSSFCAIPRRERSSAINWIDISSGGYVTTALRQDGTIWSWGCNSSGQIGDGTTINRCSPVREISSSTNWCRISLTSGIKRDGSLWKWGSSLCGNSPGGCSPVREICSATNWCSLSTAQSASTAIKTDGSLWAWGCGNCGMLGDGTTVAKCSPVREICSATDWCLVSIDVAANGTAAIKTDGSLWVWGENSSLGKLGTGTTSPSCSPVREICSATNWCYLSTGLSNKAAIKTDGSLWIWGSSSCGQLGDGTTVSKCSPVREICSATDWCFVSAYTSTGAIKTAGSLWVWGSGNCGQLGDGTTVTKCSPVRETGTSDWNKVCMRGTSVGMTLTTPIIRAPNCNCTGT